MRVGSAAFVVLLLSWLVVLPSLPFLREVLFPERPPLVAVENGTSETVVIWASTEPSVRPTGDTYPLARFGFSVKPHELGMLPNTRSWESVAVYSVGCALLAEEIVDGATRIVVGERGAVSVVPGGLPSDLAVATPTEACALVPWTPPPL